MVDPATAQTSLRIEHTPQRLTGSNADSELFLYFRLCAFAHTRDQNHKTVGQRAQDWNQETADDTGSEHIRKQFGPVRSGRGKRFCTLQKAGVLQCFAGFEEDVAIDKDHEKLLRYRLTQQRIPSAAQQTRKQIRSKGEHMPSDR